MLRINAFGRPLEIQRRDDAWLAFDIGNEGKKRPARDISIPASVPEGDIPGYLADLLHEYASARHPNMLVLD